MTEQNETEKVEIKLERHLWPDEEAALKEKKQKKLRLFLIGFLMVLAIAVSLFIGIYLGANSTPTAVIPNNTQNESAEFTRFKTIYNTLLNDWYFADQLENPEGDLIERAVDGMIGTDLDPHTDYMTASEVQSFAESIDMGFVGIGIQYSVLEDSVMVERVFRGSPADIAGLVPGDRITKVDNEAVAGWDTEKLAGAVKGEEGTIVNITYLRQNDEYSVDITRATVENSVYGEIKGDIGYIELYQFSSAAPTEIAKYLDYFKEQGLSKLIIDVRDDGGGYLTSLIGVADLFLDEGQIILSQEYTDGSKVTSKATGKTQYTNFTDIIILGNQNSASASEALIGCLTQNGKATFVGTTTYGKSTIQIPTYYADGSALKYTYGIWKTPNGSIINNVGIAPDVEVQLHPVLGMNIIQLADEESYQYDQVNEKVATAQQCLDFLGYDIDRTDGYYSALTRSAVSAFQKAYELPITGILNAETASLLCSEVTREWNANTAQYDTQMSKALELLHE